MLNNNIYWQIKEFTLYISTLIDFTYGLVIFNYRLVNTESFTVKALQVSLPVITIVLLLYFFVSPFMNP